MHAETSSQMDSLSDLSDANIDTLFHNYQHLLLSASQSLPFFPLNSCTEDILLFRERLFDTVRCMFIRPLFYSNDDPPESNSHSFHLFMGVVNFASTIEYTEPQLELDPPITRPEYLVATLSPRQYLRQQSDSPSASSANNYCNVNNNGNANNNNADDEDMGAAPDFLRWSEV